MNKLGIAERVITRRAARKLLDGSYGFTRGRYGDVQPGPGRHQVCSVGAVMLAGVELGVPLHDDEASFGVERLAEKLWEFDNNFQKPENNVLVFYSDSIAEGPEDAARMLYLLSVAEVR